MGDAIDWLREEWQWGEMEPSEFDIVSSSVTQRDLIRAIDEYDAVCADAGRLIAEVAELKLTIVGRGVMMKAVGEQRDEWKRRASEAEARVAVLEARLAANAMVEEHRATHKPHPDDEADCAVECYTQ